MQLLFLDNVALKGFPGPTILKKPKKGQKIDFTNFSFCKYDNFKLNI